MAQYCIAYVEVTDVNTGVIGSGWAWTPECSDDSCWQSLNLAANYAADECGCRSNNACQVTFWSYGCRDVTNERISPGDVRQFFPVLPSESRTIVPLPAP